MLAAYRAGHNTRSSVFPPALCRHNAVPAGADCGGPLQAGRKTGPKLLRSPVQPSQGPGDLAALRAAPSPPLSSRPGSPSARKVLRQDPDEKGRPAAPSLPACLHPPEAQRSPTVPYRPPAAPGSTRARRRAPDEPQSGAYWPCGQAGRSSGPNPAQGCTDADTGPRPSAGPVVTAGAGARHSPWRLLHSRTE